MRRRSGGFSFFCAMVYYKNGVYFLVLLTLVGCVLPRSSKHSKQRDPYAEFESTFENFRLALLNQDCEGLARICKFPLSPSGVHLISNKVDTLPSGGLSKLLLLENCELLDSLELTLLAAFLYKEGDFRTVVDKNVYRTNFYFDSIEHHFRFEIGLIEVKNDDLGEYSIIFQFDEIDRRWLLNQIFIAG